MSGLMRLPLLSITTMTMTKFKGYVLQRTSSPIDGKPLVIIMTMKSANRKTDNMCQIWILREDVNPVAAVESGADLSMCGWCSHRKQDDGSRSCYVNPGQAPLAVWESYHRGIYGELDDLTPDLLQDREVRFGAYGDPAMMNPVIARWIVDNCKAHTGYTHQWKRDFADWTKGLFMASCDHFQDYLDASSLGWKCFSVIPKGTTAKHIGKLCPTEATNSQATCKTCKLCDGAKTDVFIPAHGRGAKYVKF